MLLAFFFFVPSLAAAPTAIGTTPTVQETDKTGKFRSGEEESSPPDTDTNYRELAYKIAAQNNVSGAEMVRVINCENKEWNPTQQSRNIYHFSSPKRGIVEGTRERSYGLVMIHLPDHPDISYSEATDPVFALTWMAKEFKKGHQQQWSCY